MLVFWELNELKEPWEDEPWLLRDPMSFCCVFVPWLLIDPELLPKAEVCELMELKDPREAPVDPCEPNDPRPLWKPVEV